MGRNSFSSAVESFKAHIDTLDPAIESVCQLCESVHIEPYRMCHRIHLANQQMPANTSQKPIQIGSEVAFMRLKEQDVFNTEERYL